MNENLKCVNYWSNKIIYASIREAQEYFKENPRKSVQVSSECLSGCGTSSCNSCATGCSDD